MHARSPSYLLDIVEIHLDELPFLWGQRQAALRSPEYTGRSFLDLEERIAAHLDGILVVGAAANPLLNTALAADEPLPVFAAAFTLLHRRRGDDVARVLDAFVGGDAGRLDGLTMALSHGPAEETLSRVWAALDSESAPVAAASAQILACHSALRLTADQLHRFVTNDDPRIRQTGWRVATYCGLTPDTTLYEAAFHDDDPGVRRLALSAAAWAGYAGFAAYCRAAATNPTPALLEPLTMLAAIAPPEEYQLVGAVGSDPVAGPERFRVVGAFGHPYFVGFLIEQMENPDPVTAAGAAVAFEKMTGRSVESDARIVVSNGKPPADAFEAAFQDEVTLPDSALARKHWEELAPRLGHAPRICRGFDVSGGVAQEAFAVLDMESRWEYCLRMRLFSGWQGTPLVLERYPQRF